MFICGQHQCLGATGQHWLLTDCQQNVDVFSTPFSSVYLAPKTTEFDEITPFKVTDFCTNGKHVCDFLRVNTNLHPTLHRFRGLLVKFSVSTLDREGCLALTHSYEVKPRFQDCEIWSQQTRHIVQSCSAKQISIS